MRFHILLSLYCIYIYIYYNIYIYIYAPKNVWRDYKQDIQDEESFCKNQSTRLSWNVSRVVFVVTAQF